MKLAFELNGIVHYEPIYGTDKFNKIQNRDKQKIISCYKQGIELVVIDSTKINSKNQNKYYNLIKEIIEQNYQRTCLH